MSMLRVPKRPDRHRWNWSVVEDAIAEYEGERATEEAASNTEASEGR